VAKDHDGAGCGQSPPLSRHTVAAFVSLMSRDDVWIITGPKSLTVDMSFDVANVRG